VDRRTILFAECGLHTVESVPNCATALGCTPVTASQERAGCVPSEVAATRISSSGCIAHPLAGGADHYLDAAVALATRFVGFIALGPFRAETARLDPIS
jgi:hypothetical protein